MTVKKTGRKVEQCSEEFYLFSDRVSRHQLRFDGDEEGEEGAFA